MWDTATDHTEKRIHMAYFVRIMNTILSTVQDDHVGERGWLQLDYT